MTKETLIDKFVAMLSGFGFELKEYSDDKFYVMVAYDSEPRFYAITSAIGYSGYEYESTKIILQCRENLTDWQYSFGSYAGSLEPDDVMRIRRVKPMAI